MSSLRVRTSIDSANMGPGQNLPALTQEGIIKSDTPASPRRLERSGHGGAERWQRHGPRRAGGGCHSSVRRFDFAGAGVTLQLLLMRLLAALYDGRQNCVTAVNMALSKVEVFAQIEENQNMTCRCLDNSMRALLGIAPVVVPVRALVCQERERYQLPGTSKAWMPQA